jgi:hypothetical protein
MIRCVNVIFFLLFIRRYNEMKTNVLTAGKLNLAGCLHSVLQRLRLLNLFSTFSPHILYLGWVLEAAKTFGQILWK